MARPRDNLERVYAVLRYARLTVGGDAGFNIAPEPAYYGLPFQPLGIPVRGDGNAIVREFLLPDSRRSSAGSQSVNL
ncbi:hypothetical protein OAD56_03815 [Gammaproteobacteria bacterium]|nr:hypothetical protein [Gammaproteobacteria bacterium]